MAKSYRELKVWQSSIDLAEEIYQLTASFPKTEMYGLALQMRRASVSIASNIAEGSARTTKRDFHQFVIIARGSNNELQTQLTIAQRTKFGDLKKYGLVRDLSEQIGRGLTGLANYLRKP